MDELADLQAEYAMVQAAIAARMAGGGVEEYQEASERVRSMSIDQLRNWARDLRAELRALGGTGTSFSFGVAGDR